MMSEEAARHGSGPSAFGFHHADFALAVLVELPTDKQGIRLRP